MCNRTENLTIFNSPEAHPNFSQLPNGVKSGEMSQN